MFRSSTTKAFIGGLIISLLFGVIVTDTGTKIAEAARENDVWVARAGSYIESSFSAGRDILIKGANKYLNFNTISGSSGYGIRDNAGTIECKDSGGAWSACQDGTGGGGGSTLHVDGGGFVFPQTGDYHSAPFYVGTSTSASSTFVSASTTSFAIADVTSAIPLTDADGNFSEYTGTSCSNQFTRALSALGVGTCETVSLTADVLGTLPVGNGGTGATSFTNTSVIFSNGTIYKEDNANFVYLDSTKRLGIGTPSPNAPLEVEGSLPGNVGGFSSGILQVTNSGTGANDNAVITGHNNNSTNKQLWYFGSMSASSDDIAFINRQNAEMHFHTNNTHRMVITAGGDVGIGTTTPSELLTVGATLTQQFLVSSLGVISDGVWNATPINTTYILDDTILANDLSTTTVFLDGEFLAYVSATGNFTTRTCAEITGSAGLCDGNDATGGGGGLSTSTAIADTEIIWATGLDAVGSEAAFTYNDATNVLLYDFSSSSISTSSNLAVTGVFNFLGTLITNVSTWWEGLFDGYVSGGTGVTVSSGAISFDCSEVEGTGINCATEAITLDATGDWTGTLDGIEGAAFEVQLTNEAGLYAVLSDVSQFWEAGDTFTSGGTGSGFTLDFTNSTLSGVIPTANGGTGTSTPVAWSVTIASTSVAFISAGLFPVPSFGDAYTMSRITCKVDGGTSKPIAIEDASANSTEDITCGTSVTADDGSITNASVTADEEMYIDFGATSGSVNYVTITVYK